MVAQETIQIILEAVDRAEKVLKDNENNVKRFGDAAKQANQKVTQSSQLTQKQMESLSHHIAGVVKSTDKIGQGKTKFDQYTKSVNDSQIAFKRLDSETQDMLRYLSQMSDKGRETFLGMSSNARDAVSKFNEMKNATTGWNNTLDITKTKMQLAGTNVDSLKGKIQVVGSAITTHLGNKWESLKGKVSSFGGFIKSNLTSALSTVRSHIDSLGSAFSGLGGIISSAIGAIGMASISQMTVGLAMNRERMTALTQATMGSAEAGQHFVDVMDDLTNTSLVSLDDLGQAMSTIKMSTGMTNEQLEKFTTTVNDVGQRAILMGKSGDEAMSLMQAAGRGLNGEFDMLKSNFGITKEQLEQLGWSGAADDVEGYQAALDKALESGGSMNGMMDTSVGHLESLKKNFRVAGRHVGEMFTPYIDQAVQMLNGLNDSCPGLFENLVMVAGAISGFATIAPTIAPALTAFDLLAGKTKSVLTFFGLMKGAEDALTISTVGNTIAEKANAIAKAAGGAAAVTATGANAGLTASLWAMTTALLANPITWVVVALIALAAAVYEVGKYFGWWKDIPSMLGAVWSGVNRLWSAFINHPDVQAALQAIGSGLSWLGGQIMGAIKWVLQFFNISTGDNWDVVSTIIHGIGDAWNGLKNIVGTVIGVFQAIYNAALPIGQAIYNALKPIVCILLGCSPGIVPALKTVLEVFSSVWNTIAGFIGGVITTVISAIQPLIDLLSQIVNFYLSSFIYAWQTMIMVFNIVITAVNTIINIFTLFLNGQINLQTMLSMIWTTLSQMFALVLTTIINRVSSWASNLLSRAINAGRGFVNGVIRYVSGLPGKFGAYLINIIGRIASAGASWISTAVSKASSMVSGVIIQVSQLPGKVYTEFMNIGSRMLEAGSQLIEKAKQIGKQIVDGLLGAMGIHSPGIIQESVVAEFVNMIDRVGSKVKSAKDTAKAIGNAIVDGFGKPSLETDVSNILPNEDALKTSIGVQAELSHQVSDVPSTTATMDTSGVDTSNTDVIGSYDNLANMTGSALQSMVDRDKLAYDTMRIHDASTLSAMTLNLQQKMSSMTSNVSSSMNNIVAKNRSSMNNVNNTTKSNLNSIVSKTKSANNQMIKSWGIMKDGIIQAADKIRSDSTAHFDKLSKTIGTFYGKLKNPSRWGAGSPITRSRGSSSRGFGKIKSAIQNANLPKYLSLGQLKANPSIVAGDFGDYISRDKKNNMFNVADLLRYGAIKLVGGNAGGYSNIPSPNVKLIKDTSKEWDMKGPLVGKYSTSHGFKVKEFLSGVPQITYDVFRAIAEDVYSQTHYEFYYDNDHHGNWINAFNSGGMNCLHGAQSLIALANAMGLSGSLVHGHWTDSSGTYGHYWANIAGHKMDVTGWQQRRTWTPSASAGSAPKNYGIKNLIDELKNIFKDDDPKNTPGTNALEPSSNESNLKGEFTFVHDFKKLPEGISAEEVAKIVENSATNDNFVKKLVKYARFQELDSIEKTRLEKRKNRAKGV